jgi:outer membrane protein assembly factor BamB
MTFTWRALIIPVLGLLVMLSAAMAGDPGAVPAAGQWPHWRGPTFQGTSDDPKAPQTWGEENVLWKARLPGGGNSTPIVWGDRMYLTASGPGGVERFVLAVGTADGKVLWQQQAVSGAAAEKSHEWNGYASPSCATDGERVYAFFGTPGLFCFDRDGKLLWEHRFGVFVSETGWGVGATPFLFEDLVIQNCDNDGPKFLPPGSNPADAAPAALVALDKRTGKEVWRTERNQGRGFSTPILVKTPAGRVDLVLNGPLGVWAYDPRSGKEVWHCDRKHTDEDKFGEPLPVAAGDRLYATAGRPGTLQAIRLGGTGDLSQSGLIWEASRKDSRDVSSPLLAGGVIYLTDRQSRISGHDAQTGKLLFRERTPGGGKPFVASGVRLRDKLLFLREDGTTFVVEPGRPLKIVGKSVLADGTEFRASPAIADGRIYLRSQTTLYAVGGK